MNWPLHLFHPVENLRVCGGSSTNRTHQPKAVRTDFIFVEIGMEKMSQSTEASGVQLNKGLILAVMVAGAFVAILNETLLNVALPPIMRDFHITANTAQWLTTAYMLTNGVLIPVSAFLLQRFSTRALFITAMALFAAGTIVAGLAPDFALLLVGRVIQASGAAIMLPLLMNVILTIYPIEQRGSAMGIMGLVITFAPAIGPTLSGWLVEHHSWRLLFFIVLPIALLDMVFAMVSLRNVSKLSSPKIDVVSVILSTFGFGGLLYGFSSAGTTGWNSTQVYVSLAIAVVGLLLFVTRQLRASNPMLEFRVFRYNMFALTTVINVLVTMAMFSSMLLFPLYLQNIHGFTPFQSGFLVLPGAILMGIMSPITGMIFDKIGARWLAVVGSLLTAATMIHFSMLTTTTRYSVLIVSFAVMMFGMSLLMMPIMTAGLNQLPQRLNPHGTAMANTLQQVAGAIGTALLVTVMTDTTKSHLQKLMATAKTPMTTQTQLADVTKLASVHGIDQAFMVGSVIALLALILSFFIRKTKPSYEHEEASSLHMMGDTRDDKMFLEKHPGADY